MIYKSAISRFKMDEITASVADSMIKTAAAKIELRKGFDPESKSIIQAEIQKHPDALFFKAKAIAADEVNSNGDYFPKDELLKSYATFVGVPFYTNHENQDITKAKGKIIHAEWNDKDNAAYVVGFVDREAYPHICRGIEQDYMGGVSMGCSVEYSTCSICGNRAESADSYCNHIKFKKGRKFTGSAKDVITGETKKFDNAMVFEKNYGIRFIELSGVGDPACRSCRIEGVFDNNEAMQKAAKIENNLLMYKETSLSKSAGQQEVQQLEEALKTIKDISIKLIQASPKVELNFPSDLVKILAELQEFTDELVGAGYGQLEDGSAPGGIPGVDQSLAGMPPAQDGQFGAPPQAVAVSEPLPGEVTGAPSNSPVKMPVMPTAPTKGLGANTQNTLNKISETLGSLVKGLRKAKNENGENDMRRTPQLINEQKKEVMSGLNSSWEKGKRLVSENTGSGATINVKENGGNDMNRVAGRAEAPDQITENQLSLDKGMHARENNERDQVTQGQLRDLRTHADPDQVTEVQIEGKRTGNVPETITQEQLDHQTGSLACKDENRQTTTQDQLKGQRTNKETDVTIEKQLEGGNVFSRSAFSRKNIKAAGDHVQPVIDVLATSAIFLGATPEQIQKSSSSMVSSIKAKHELLDKITSSKASKKIDGLEVAARMKYWGGVSGMRFASLDSKEVEDQIASGLHNLVASDSGISPEVVLDVMEVVGEDSEGSSRIAESIDAQLSSKVEETVAPSRKSEITAALKQKSLDLQPTPATPEAAKAVRESERKAMMKALAGKPTHAIEASFKEVGVTKEEMASAKKDIKVRASVENKITAFVTSQSAILGKKFAGKEGITNVKVNEDTVEIAIKWGGGDDELSGDVNLSLPGSDGDIAPDVTAPEGDVAGDNLDALTSTPPAPAMAPAGGMPAGGMPPPPAGGMPAAASSKGKMSRVAQTPAGGGIPGGPLGGGSDPSGGLMGGDAAGVPGVQTFSEKPADEEKDEKLPGAGEQMLPGSICPFCRSTDTNVGQEGREAGTFGCENCGAIYKFSVNVEVLNPNKMSFEKSGVEGVDEPKLPEMPVAASIDLTKGNLVRLAKCEKQHGHVCPACGTGECKSQEDEGTYASYTCPSCNTKVAKEIFIDKDDPDKSCMRVAWTVNPKKVFTNKDCTGCNEKARMFLARKKVAMMLTAASKQDPDQEFPMANCMEKIASRYGSNALATFGPCKGKPLADCVCKQLKQFNMRKTRFLDKFAELYTSKDPMDQCIEDHSSKGYKTAQSLTICEALRKENLGEEDLNMFLAALDGDKDFSKHELRAMNEAYVGMTKVAQSIEEEVASEPIDESDIGDMDAIKDPVPPVEPEAAEVVSDSVTVEIPVEVAKDIADQLTSVTEQPSPVAEESAEESIEVPAEGSAEEVFTPGAPEVGSAGELEVAAKVKKNKMNKEAFYNSRDIEHFKQNPHLMSRDTFDAIKKDNPTAFDEADWNQYKEVSKLDKFQKVPPRDGTPAGDIPSRIKTARDLITKIKDKEGLLAVSKRVYDEYVLIHPETEISPSDETWIKGVSGKLINRIKAHLKEAYKIANNRAMLNEMDELKQLWSEVLSVEHGSIDLTAKVKENKMNKEAEKATLVKNIETEVSSGIPRGKATMGKEGPDNINKPMAQPSIPRGKATMGNEGADNIDKAMSAPDIATGAAYMGSEKQVQKSMPGNSLKEKGTVIAGKEEPMQKVAKTPEHVENIETEVTSKVPRGNATLGNEGKDNIDVPMNDPKIPTGKATLGNEGKDNIDVPMNKVDVPTGDAYLGGEKDAQKGLPGNSLKEKGTIIAEQKGEQIEKIAKARWQKAATVAARYLAAGHIKQDEFDGIVDDLSKLSFERIEAFAERMFKRPAAPAQRTAATQGEVLTAAVIQESSAIETPHEDVKQSFESQLRSVFTVGSYGLTKELSEKK